MFHDRNYIIVLVGKHATKICHYFADKSMHVSISLVGDASIIVRGLQILRYHNKIIGGCH